MTALIRITTWCAAMFAAASTLAQQYPNKPVRIIVPFAPGGVTDVAGRLIAQKLFERLGQQFIVENQGGAGGNIGMANVARAGADGYTILFSSSSIVVNPSLYTNIQFDAERDFIPVTKVGGSPNSWIVNANFPARTKFRRS